MQIISFKNENYFPELNVFMHTSLTTRAVFMLKAIGKFHPVTNFTTHRPTEENKTKSIVILRLNPAMGTPF